GEDTRPASPTHDDIHSRSRLDPSSARKRPRRFPAPVPHRPSDVKRRLAWPRQTSAPDLPNAAAGHRVDPENTALPEGDPRKPGSSRHMHDRLVRAAARREAALDGAALRVAPV